MSQNIQTGKRQKAIQLQIFFLSLVYFQLPTFYSSSGLGQIKWGVSVAQAQTLPTEVRQAYTLLGQGLVRDAIASFKRALEHYPQSLPAKLGLSIAYRRQGLTAEAWTAYQQVLAQDPTNQLALKTVGLLGGYRPEWQQQGIAALTTLLNLNPNDTEARTQRGLLYGYQRRFAEALADYQLVLQTNPTPEAFLGAAQVYTSSGYPAQGLELFNRYRATGKPITGYDAIAYGQALRETGNPTAAVQVLQAQLQRSTKLDNLAIQTRVELSRAYLANQQSTEALAVLDLLAGRADTNLVLARSLSEIRRRIDARELDNQIASLCRQAIARSSDPQVVREAADILSSLPTFKQTALHLYQQLAARQPDDQSLIVKQLALASQMGLISKTDLRTRLATALQTPSDRNQQQRTAQALAAIDPPGPEFLPLYQNLLQAGVNQPFLNFRIAQLLLQNNDEAGARRALAAYAATPTGARDLAPQLLAAEIERREGHLEFSAQRYQTLIALNPPDNDILNSALRGLAGIRLQQHQPDEALAIYDQLVARNPQDLTTQLGRASIAYQAKRITEFQAETVLNSWLQTQPATEAPPELFGLVGILPPEAQREPLYKALIQFDPNNIPVQLRLIQVIAARSPAEARARVIRLAARNPNNPGAYFLQGQLAQGIGDLSLASSAYQKILTQDPDNTDALSALGGIRFQERQFDSAEQLYSQILAIKPDPEVRRTLADLTAAQDRPLDALKQLEQLQLEQIASGAADGNLSHRMQQIQEDFLRRRGFQPFWERY